MKYRGEHKDVPLRGIELAGSDRTISAGAMNELIGLVERDGSLEPYGLKPEFTRAMPHNGKSIFVHKTSMGDNVLVLFSTGELQWTPKSEFDNPTEYPTLTWTQTGLTGVKEIALVGNMITDQNLRSVVFAGGQYVVHNTVFDRDSLPNISLKVECNHTFEGDNAGESGEGNTVFTWQKVADQEDDISATEKKEAIISLATKAIGQWNQKGGLTGYVMAVVAYRLTNGEYVLASTPQILGEPFVRYKDGILRRKDGNNLQQLEVEVDEDTSVPADTYTLTKLAALPIGDKNDDSKKIYLNHPVPPSGNLGHVGFDLHLKEYSQSNINLIQDDCYLYYHYYGCTPIFLDSLTDIDGDDGVVMELATNPQECVTPAIMGIVNYRKRRRSGHGNIDEHIGLVTCRANAMFYKIDETISQNYANVIDSVCIFISKQVNGFKLTQQGIYNSGRTQTYLYNASADTIREYVTALYPSPKTQSDIIDELKKCDVFYKVKEIPFDEITSGDWQIVDLEGKLGDNLYTQPSLLPSAFTNTKTLNGKLFTYNNRVHVFDYQQHPSELKDIRPFKYFTGYGQLVPTTIGDDIYWRVVAECRSTKYGPYILDTGYVSGTAIPFTNFSGLISYPNPECKHITINIKTVPQSGTAVVYTKEFDMEKWGDTNLAVNWRLAPYEWTEFTSPTAGSDAYNSAMVMTDTSGLVFDYKNSMKASDVAYPFFPPAQTYTIGKSKIIGMSTFSIPLSQDTFGKYPLLVFCDDGIFSMAVDETGTLAYKSIAPFGREVCTSRKSICQLDGAVLFVSRRGLMLCTERGIEQIAKHALGRINHLPQNNTNKGSGLKVLYKALNDSSIMLTKVEGWNCISDVPFEDFIKYDDTEIVYLATKQSVLIYCPSTTMGHVGHTYLVGLDTGRVCKLPISISRDDGNYPETLFNASGSFLSAGIYSGEDCTQCIFQTRPIYLGGILRETFRVLLRGDFRSLDPTAGNDPYRAGIYVLGSLDGERWHLIGGKEKELSSEGFHDFGCETYRDDVAYIMVAFTGYLHKSSHIDRMEVDGMYN